MNEPYRFEDENLVISNFFNDVLLVCAACSAKAVGTLHQRHLKRAQRKNTFCTFGKTA